MRNKRGDIAIVLLVFLVLALTAATLFTFSMSSRAVKVEISESRFVEELYLKENLVEFYIREAGEDAISKTFKEVEEINLEFEDNFRENFRREFKSRSYVEPYQNNLRNYINRGNFDFSIKGNLLVLRVEGWMIEDSFEGTKVDYYPKLEVSFNLAEYKNKNI